MAYKCLRDWLETVELRGELKRISGASADLEMSGIAEIICRGGKDPKPLLLFDDIPGYPGGYRTLFGLFGSPWRIASGLGLPEDRIDRMSLVRNWTKRFKDLPLIPPKMVSSGPVQTNSLTGLQVDLEKLPAPRFHELDGGRYLGTCHAVIQRDPDTGWVNAGAYRIMLVDRNRLALHAIEGKHGSIIMNKKYFARGQVMPVAIALGIDPAWWWMSTGRAPWGVSEYDYVGGIKGQAEEVINGPYTKLPLPAHAEVVIEGECHPGDLVDEGPFGEWNGYYGNLGVLPVPEPVVRVKAIYHRDNPILTCSQMSVPPHDSTLMMAVSWAADMWASLETLGIPGVKGVWGHEAGCAKLFNVVSIEQLYSGHSREVGLIISQRPNVGKYTVVVEDDIDPSNLEEVVWAITTRAMPKDSIQILERCRSGSSDTTIPVKEKKQYQIAPKPLYSSRVVIDACRPLESKNEWYPIAGISPQLREQIFEKWKDVLSGVV
ncbi:MAG: UbiD family decarboxylase [Chloroflexi bacterium]|nr:UbiD family decarboxylase [Chloroflexota bacterium]